VGVVVVVVGVDLPIVVWRRRSVVVIVVVGGDEEGQGLWARVVAVHFPQVPWA
jgi:hypothetical protein